jgi:hypothetical protein
LEESGILEVIWVHKTSRINRRIVEIVPESEDLLEHPCEASSVGKVSLVIDSDGIEDRCNGEGCGGILCLPATGALLKGCNLLFRKR